MFVFFSCYMLRSDNSFDVVEEEVEESIEEDTDSDADMFSPSPQKLRGIFISLVEVLFFL